MVHRFDFIYDILPIGSSPAGEVDHEHLCVLHGLLAIRIARGFELRGVSRMDTRAMTGFANIFVVYVAGLTFRRIFVDVASSGADFTLAFGFALIDELSE